MSSPSCASTPGLAVDMETYPFSEHLDPPQLCILLDTTQTRDPYLERFTVPTVAPGPPATAIDAAGADEFAMVFIHGYMTILPTTAWFWVVRVLRKDMLPDLDPTTRRFQVPPALYASIVDRLRHATPPEDISGLHTTTVFLEQSERTQWLYNWVLE